MIRELLGDEVDVVSGATQTVKSFPTVIPLAEATLVPGRVARDVEVTSSGVFRGTPELDRSAPFWLGPGAALPQS